MHTAEFVAVLHFIAGRDTSKSTTEVIVATGSIYLRLLAALFAKEHFLLCNALSPMQQKPSLLHP